MDRDALQFARAGVVLAVLWGLLAVFHLWRAVERGGESWLMAATWGALALLWAALST